MFVRFRKLPCDGLRPDAASFEAARFLQVYAAYKENQQVTKRRMYLETMQNLLSGIDKVIMDRGVQGAVPYLPLNELRRQIRESVNSQAGQITR